MPDYYNSVLVLYLTKHASDFPCIEALHNEAMMIFKYVLNIKL